MLEPQPPDNPPQQRRIRLWMLLVLGMLVGAGGVVAFTLIDFEQIELPDLPSIERPTAIPSPYPTFAPPTQDANAPVINVTSDEIILPADGISTATITFTIDNLPEETIPVLQMNGASTLISDIPEQVGDEWQTTVQASATTGESTLLISVLAQDGLNTLASEMVRVTTYDEPLEIEVLNAPNNNYTRLEAGEDYALEIRLRRSDSEAIEGQYQLLAGLDSYDTGLLNGEGRQQTLIFADGIANLTYTAPTLGTVERRELAISVRNQNVSPYRITFESVVPLQGLNITSGDVPLQQLVRDGANVINMQLTGRNTRGDVAIGYPVRVDVMPINIASDDSLPQLNIDGRLLSETDNLFFLDEDGQLDLNISSVRGGGIFSIQVEEAFFDNAVSVTSEPIIAGFLYVPVTDAMPSNADDWRNNRAVQIDDNTYFGFLYDLNGGRRVLNNYEVLALDPASSARVPVLARFYVPAIYVRNGQIVFPTDLDPLRRAENLTYLPALPDNTDDYYDVPNPMAILAKSDFDNAPLYITNSTQTVDVVGGGTIEMVVVYATGTMSIEALPALAP